MKVTEEIVYVGVNDHELDLFEGQYAVPAGMAYNSYVICDEKTAVMDSVEYPFCGRVAESHRPDAGRKSAGLHCYPAHGA